MKNLKFISSADAKWGIGNKGKLLSYVKEDMKRFTSLTKGNLIVTGRKTIATFKNQKPLKNRINIILTTDKNYENGEALIAHSVDEVLEIVKDRKEEIYIIGGESVFKQFLPYCNEAYITKFKIDVDADAFIENLDESDEWIIDEESQWLTSEKGVEYKFCDYRRIKEYYGN